jgi:hypothetical protein
LFNFSRRAWWWLFFAAAIPISLLWDFSWESTVGIDLLWSPPHVATYLAVALAGITALCFITGTTLARTESGAPGVSGVRLGRLETPLGGWLAAWGALAFLAAALFDRWWQAAYGLGAGIWHPPQIAKAVAFFALLIGSWLLCLNRQNQPDGRNGGGAMAFAVSGGLVISMISIVTLISGYPNRQHSAWFYKVACGTYPIVLVALTTAGRLRFSATVGSVAYMAIVCAMVWLLPLFPATPQTAPIYNRLDHMMPPPFPLLLIIPALALDCLSCAWRSNQWRGWLQPIVAGFAFCLLFFGTQWVFAKFLLTNLADNWFFAGGGQHWPFFLKISPAARQAFWHTGHDQMDWASALIAVGLAIIAVRVGLWVGAWMRGVRR